MIAWGANPFQNSLAPVLKNPDTKLETIFKNNQFLNLLRQETPDVVAFLSRDGIMSQLIQYALTTELSNGQNSKRFQSMAVAILSGGTSRLQDAISRNQILLESIKQFPDSPYSRNAVVCGNFSLIVQFLARSTNGEILGTDLKFLSDFLLKNLDLFALRELFKCLIVDFTIPFCVSTEMLHELLDRVDTEALVFPALFLLRDVAQEKPDLLSLFDDDESVGRLLSLGIDSYFSKPLIAKEAFSILYSIFETKAMAEPCWPIGKRVFEYHTTVNCATAAALLVFPESVVYFIRPFFAGMLPTMLSGAVMQVVARLPGAALSDLAAKTHLCQLAIEGFAAYSLEKTNGHFIELVRLFSERGMYCCKAHKKQWKQFTSELLRGRYQLVMSHYGGRAMSDAVDIEKDLFQSMDDLYSILAADEDD
jgi:hypothetical protein